MYTFSKHGIILLFLQYYTFTVTLVASTLTPARKKFDDHSFRFQVGLPKDQLLLRPDSNEATMVTQGGSRHNFMLPLHGLIEDGVVVVWAEVRWSPNLKTMNVVEKACFDLSIEFHACMELVRHAENVSELGSLGQQLMHVPDILLHYVTAKDIANTDYSFGHRSLQIRLGSVNKYAMRKGMIGLQGVGFVVVSADEHLKTWVESKVDNSEYDLVLEIGWSYPETSAAELASCFAECIGIFPFESLDRLYAQLSGMNRYGPNISNFTRYVNPSYAVNQHLDLKLSAQGVPRPDDFPGARLFGTFGLDFPDVRFFPGEVVTGSDFINFRGIPVSITGSENAIMPPPKIAETTPLSATEIELATPIPLVAIAMTVYKRSHLAEQIAAIANQTLAHRFVVYVCQNENHVEVRPLLEMLRSGVADPEVQRSYAPHAAKITLPLPFEIHHIHSPSLNQKYHGRFAFLNMISAEYVALFDDDKIPGPRWVEHALGESRMREAIVGYSGRLWIGPTWYHVPLYRTPDTVQVDYVGQCWVFKSDWIRYMWQDRPVNVENAEDMQFSAQALIHGGIRTFIASQPGNQPEVWCDSKPSYGIDNVSSSISSDAGSWKRERSGILNYMIVARGFVPLLHRAPFIALSSHALIYDKRQALNENGFVSHAEMQKLLGEKIHAKVETVVLKPTYSPVKTTEDSEVPRSGDAPQRGTFHVMVVLGTRPEGIKLAPVILELQKRIAKQAEKTSPQQEEFYLRQTVVSTGQHRQMLKPVLTNFGISVDIELDVMAEKEKGQAAASSSTTDLTESDTRGGAVLPGLAARILTALDDVLRAHSPDVVVVQGDTSSALLGALGAFYHQIPVAHVEAGLRTGRRYDPFPEEMHRRLITALATLHFAPTPQNAWNILGEMAPAAAAAAALSATALNDEYGDEDCSTEEGGDGGENKCTREAGATNLLASDDRSGVHVVGSTAIDAVNFILNQTRAQEEEATGAAAASSSGGSILPEAGGSSQAAAEAAAAAAVAHARSLGGALLLVTAHRRENLGLPMRRICGAVRDLAARYPKLVVAFPVHLSPQVQAVVRHELACKQERHSDTAANPSEGVSGGSGGVSAPETSPSSCSAGVGSPECRSSREWCARVHLLPPLDHSSLVRTLAASWLVLSDSGGLQEEAPALGVPLLVLRRRTERVEGLHAGAARLVGTNRRRIVKEASKLLDSFGEESDADDSSGGGGGGGGGGGPNNSSAYASMAKLRYPYGDGHAATAVVDILIGRRHELLALRKK